MQKRIIYAILCCRRLQAAFFSHRNAILMLFSLPAFKVLLDVLHAFLTEDRTLYAPSLLI